MSKKVQEEIKLLTKELKTWSDSYYKKNVSIVSDEVYDANLIKLQQLEKQYPEFVLKDSPTLTIGAPIQSGEFKKIQHKQRMYSLDNAFNDNQLQHFFNSVNKVEQVDEYFCEYKLDGISISVTYNDGKIVQALTRGNGEVGEVVTETAKLISNIPLTIPIKEKITIRGEVFFELNNFEQRNRELQEQGLNIYKNPRNAVSGILRRLNTDEAKKSKLSVAFFDIVLNDLNFEINSQQQLFDFFKKNNLPTMKFSKMCKKADVMKYINKAISERKNINVWIDGIVIKVNDFEIRKKIGYTTKFPKWAIAYKLPAKLVKTKIKNIFVTIGRTGKATYNAAIEPVLLEGTTVSSATLHNFSWLSEKDIRINDVVQIHKAGGIIPEVVSVVLNERTQDIKPYEIVNLCPYCENKLVQPDLEVDQYCLNQSCN